MRKQGFHPAPVVLALILEPMAEMGLRQSLVISKGAILPYLLGRPICVILVILITASVVSTIILERRFLERVVVEEATVGGWLNAIPKGPVAGDAKAAWRRPKLAPLYPKNPPETQRSSPTDEDKRMPLRMAGD